VCLAPARLAGSGERATCSSWRSVIRGGLAAKLTSGDRALAAETAALAATTRACSRDLDRARQLDPRSAESERRATEIASATHRRDRSSVGGRADAANATLRDASVTPIQFPGCFRR
jgi:hypothetical protein